MKAHLITLVLAGFACLLQTGCAIEANSKSSEAKIPWSRVTQVETTADTQGTQSQTGIGHGPISPGASQSHVILAWGMPPYILDSPADNEREVWQYPHAVVVFQGTKVQQVLAR